jgi:undecaprenyl-diphosphatase
LSYFQAIVIGLLQGVTELFPISSLGHSVLVPAWFGWDHLVTAQSAGESFYLAFVVALHVATAIALTVYFREDWVRIIRGFLRTLRTRRIETPDERLAWLLVVATVPAGITGLALEHSLRTLFAKPLAAAIFLTVNGVLLFAFEALRRRAPQTDEDDDTRIARQVGWGQALAVGAAQALALIPGISRSGVTMGGGLLVGLSNKDAARFAFLLATPMPPCSLAGSAASAWRRSSRRRRRPPRRSLPATCLRLRLR